MNNKRSGKPFDKKKGAPKRNSESGDSDKRSFSKGKKNPLSSSKPDKGKKDFSGEKFSRRGNSSRPVSSRNNKFAKDGPKSSFGEKKFSKSNDRKKEDSFSDRKKFSRNSDKNFASKKFDKSPQRGKREDTPANKKRLNRDSGKSLTKKFAKDSDKKKSSFEDRKKFSKPAKFTDKNSINKEPRQPVYDIKPPKKVKKEESSDGKIRLNKYIANSGVCSRRDADELISLGEVTVNGKPVTELGFKVSKDDVVTLHGRKLTPERHIYVLLNKPKDFITTTDDPQERKTVMALVQNACKERILPVGRLDRNTTGLLLFTNDGDLAEKLTHPRKKIKKIYQADLDKPITKDDFDKILNGLKLEDGPVKIDALAIVSADKKSVGIEIHEGRNRIVRRIFESLGYEVVRLDRVMYAGLTKKDLPRGNWRYLTEKEVVRLKYF